jgi:outer membrane protein TolC
VAFELENYEYYEQLAMQGSPELSGVESGIDAMRKSVDAARAQQYPMVFLGISGSFAHTPNRPRQTNPFIINNTNYASGHVGLGIRQNLNFSSMRNTVERAEIEYRRVNDLQKAVTDGIVLDLNERLQRSCCR